MAHADRKLAAALIHRGYQGLLEEVRFERKLDGARHAPASHEEKHPLDAGG